MKVTKIIIIIIHSEKTSHTNTTHLTTPKHNTTHTHILLTNTTPPYLHNTYTMPIQYLHNIPNKLPPINTREQGRLLHINVSYKFYNGRHAPISYRAQRTHFKSFVTNPLHNERYVPIPNTLLAASWPTIHAFQLTFARLLFGPPGTLIDLTHMLFKLHSPDCCLALLTL